MNDLDEKLRSTTYVSASLGGATQGQIHELATTLAKNLGFDNLLDPSDYHITLAHSQTESDIKFNTTPINKTLFVSKFEVVNLGKFIVLKFESEYLQGIFASMKASHKLNWDFEDYIPHISIAKTDKVIASMTASLPMKSIFIQSLSAEEAS